MTVTTLIMPRTCTGCSRGMKEGYCIEDGLQYFCSKNCLNTHYTDAEYEEMYAEGEGDSYWTDWEEDDADEEDPPAEMSAYAYGKRAYELIYPRIPGLDQAFCESLKREPMDEALKPLEQWLQGWDEAQTERNMYNGHLAAHS